MAEARSTKVNGKAFITGAVLRAFSSATGFALAIPAAALLVRHLGAADYGALTYAITLVAVVGSLADLGTGPAVTRMASYDRTSASSWGITGAHLTLLSSLPAAALCLVLTKVVPNDARLALAVLTPVVVAVGLRSVMSGYLIAAGRSSVVEGTLAGQQALYYGAAILLAAANVATVSLLSAVHLAAQWLFTALLILSWCRSTGGPRARSPRPMRVLLRLSLSLLLIRIAFITIQRSDIIMLGAFDGTRSVGLYAPILRIADLTTIMLNIAGSYYLPLATALVAANDTIKLRATYASLAKWTAVFVSPLLATLLVVPSPLLRFLFGAEHSAHGHIAAVLAVGYIAHAVAGPNGTTLIALGYSRAVAVVAVTSMLVTVAANATLISAYGATGAAAGTSLAYLVLNALSSAVLWHKARIHPFRRDSLSVSLTAIVSAAALWLLLSLLGLIHEPAAPLVVWAGITVIVMLVAFWTRSAQDRELGAQLRRVLRFRHPDGISA